MSIKQHSLTITTRGRSTTNITHLIRELVEQSDLTTGLCHVFIHHTSASLIITENADSDVRHDLETIFKRLAPDADPAYRHTIEGPDDMSAHIRTILTQTEMTIPITNGQLGLGLWQGVFLWEHRAHSYQRRLTVSLSG
ncbi:MAG: secondary thiamine-phosphate synthase enzyme YjbQ [Thiotrichaceae bacterium]|nr:secondary thiamine-phosphate synthase enzyme YjbQ [Thiotrichaceae bacterium]